MATWDDVRRICLALPETAETTNGWGQLSWQVRGKGFAWERPLRQKDLAELGDAAPTGPVLAVHVPDEGAKRALIADDPAVLARLDLLDDATLTELAGEAWACRAPKKLLAQHRDP